MTAAALSDKRARRKEDRRQAILDVAERSFLERGFAATSMSAIAACCGGSKTTLWSHFPSKESLFAELVAQKIEKFAADLEEALIPGDGVEAALRRFGRIYLDKLIRGDACGLRRMVIAEGFRFPRLLDEFYERGPDRTRKLMCRYMEQEMAAGRLRQGDALRAATQFMSLCVGGIFADILWNREPLSVTDPEGDAAEAVGAFMRIWGPEE